MSMKDAKGSGIDRRRNLGEHINNHIIFYLATTYFAVGSAVAGVMLWFQVERETSIKETCKQECIAAQTELKDQLSRYKHVVGNAESTLIQYDDHIIEQNREFPGVQPEVYKADVLIQPASNTEYFETPRNEPPLATLNRMRGVQSSESDDQNTNRNLVWVGKKHWNISYTNGQYAYKKLFPYIFVTRERKRFRYDEIISSILQSRFGLLVDEEKQ